MKKLLLLALLLLAAPAWAATYSLTTTTTEETIVTYVRTGLNTAACASVGLPPSCTQAQADAVRPGVTIYANNGTFLLSILRARILDEWDKQKAADRATFAALLANATPAQKDAACIALGAAAGCLP